MAYLSIAIESAESAFIDHRIGSRLFTIYGDFDEPQEARRDCPSWPAGYTVNEIWWKKEDVTDTFTPAELASIEEQFLEWHLNGAGEDLELKAEITQSRRAAIYRRLANSDDRGNEQ